MGGVFGGDVLCGCAPVGCVPVGALLFVCVPARVFDDVGHAD